MLDPRHSLTEAATTWRRHFGSTPPPPPAASQARWPILSGWRWFVPCPSRESLLFVDVDESSATATSRELGSDLAYRGILPRCLGRVLCELSEPHFARMEEGDCEAYATLRHSPAVQSELRSLETRAKPFFNAITLCQRLALGLRFVRAAYLARLEAWALLAQSSLPRVPAAPAEAIPDLGPAPPEARRSDPVTEWLLSPVSLSFRERSPLGTPTTGSCSPSPAQRTQLRTKQLLVPGYNALHSVGIPTLLHSARFWGPSLPEHSSMPVCPTAAPVMVTRQSLHPPLAGAVAACICRQRLQRPHHAHGATASTAPGARHATAGRGAHPCYSTPRPDLPQLCPDCVWAWHESAATLPEGPRGGSRS